MSNNRNIILTKEESEKVLANFGLQFKEVEPNIYKIINIDKVVDITELQVELRICGLIVSPDDELRRTEDGSSHTFSSVYYAVIGSDEDDTVIKYCNIAKKEYGEKNLMCCEYREDYGYTIDTIFYN